MAEINIQFGDGLPALIVDGEEKGRVLSLTLNANQTTGTLTVEGMTVRERFVLDGLGFDYRTVTGKEPPKVPVHPRIKVVR